MLGPGWKRQAFTGAAIGATTLIGMGLLYYLLFALSLILALEFGMLAFVTFVGLIMGVLLSSPALLIAAVGGAFFGPLAAWAVKSMRFPAVAFPMILAILLLPLILLLVGETALRLDIEIDSSERLTVFDLEFWLKYWQMGAAALVLTPLISFWLSARSLSIPPADLSRWLRPLDEDAWSRT